MTKCTDPNCKCYVKAEEAKEVKPKSILHGKDVHGGIIIIDSDQISHSFGAKDDELQDAAHSFAHYLLEKRNLLSDDFSWSGVFGQWLDSEEFKKLKFGEGLTAGNYWFQLGQVFFVVHRKIHGKIDQATDMLGSLLKSHVGEHTHDGDSKTHKSILKIIKNGKEVDPDEALEDLIDLFGDMLKDK